MNSQIDPMTSALFGYFFKNGGTNYMDFFNFHYLVGKENPSILKYVDTGGNMLAIKKFGYRKPAAAMWGIGTLFPQMKTSLNGQIWVVVGVFFKLILS